jgi:hypothetical protein
LVAAVGVFVTTQASAAYHIMKVVEVYAGSAAAPNASYVQLQMYAAGQNVVMNHAITVYDPANTPVAGSSVTFDKNVANGADQATILIGTAAVQGAFGVTPDFVLPANLLQAGGKVCFDAIPEDCFAWGTFNSATGVGTPFAALTTGMAAKRKITGGASALLLEAADDTDNCATDFEAAAPAPKNNAGVVGSPDGGTSSVDSGVSSSGGTDSGTSGKDSGVSTKPNPDAATGSSSGTTSSGGAAPAAEDDGCNASGTSPADVSLAGLGLTLAATMTVLSRLRRKKR